MLSARFQCALAYAAELHAVQLRKATEIPYVAHLLSASSSVEVDRGVKAPLYARAGIAELWIADLIAERLEVHRDPGPSGYRMVRMFGRGQQVSPLCAPDCLIEVDAILGPSDGAH